MPDGFRGNVADVYLTAVDNELAAAVIVHNTDPFRNLSSSVVAFPPLPHRANQTLPYPGSTAQTGSFSTGARNSSNIVVGQSEYDSILNHINQIDEDMATAIYDIALEIDDMCQTSYILPRTVPKCARVLDGIKSSLGDFRSLTEEALSQMRNFVQGILGIG